MKNVKELVQFVMDHGEDRETRTGKVRSIWKANMKFNNTDMCFPAVTSKQLAWRSVVGELLWFLSFSETIKDLRYYTFGPDCPDDKWSIWTDDAKRWNDEYECDDKDFVGALYPTQWRNFNNAAVDQVQTLIDNLKKDPSRRDHIVMAWNPEAIQLDKMALKPCHLGFQCYVDGQGYLHLHWWQRSVDSALGLPFNIASYALLQNLLAKWTGLKVGHLSCDLGDVHIYENHFDAVKQYLANEEFDLPRLQLPEGTETLESTLKLTALDFEDALVGYRNAGVIKAPLSVGA